MDHFEKWISLLFLNSVQSCCTVLPREAKHLEIPHMKLVWWWIRLLIVCLWGFPSWQVFELNAKFQTQNKVSQCALNRSNGKTNLSLTMTYWLRHWCCKSQFIMHWALRLPALPIENTTQLPPHEHSNRGWGRYVPQSPGGDSGAAPKTSSHGGQFHSRGTGRVWHTWHGALEGKWVWACVQTETVG